jgi:hypothetical protein
MLTYVLEENKMLLSSSEWGGGFEGKQESSLKSADLFSAVYMPLYAIKQNLCEKLKS